MNDLVIKREHVKDIEFLIKHQGGLMPAAYIKIKKRYPDLKL